MKDLHVTVVPKGVTILPGSRSQNQHDVAIDVAVQKKLDKADNTEIDALMGLVDEIADRFRLKRLDSYPGAVWLEDGAAAHLQPGAPGPDAAVYQRVDLHLPGGAMIGYRIDSIKGLFFDSAKVRAATSRAERRVLSRFGAFVRRSARSSIRKRKRSSAPGQPPSSHTGLLKRFIFFAYEPRSGRSVVIGPVRLNQKIGDAPAALEHGGRSQVVAASRRRKRAGPHGHRSGRGRSWARPSRRSSRSCRPCGPTR